MTSVIGGILLFTLGFLCGAAAFGLLRRNRYTQDLTQVPDYLQRGTPAAPSAPRAPPPYSPSTAGDLQQQVITLLQRKRKIEAIKVYKDATGVGLKEAKDAVEAVERTLPR